MTIALHEPFRAVFYTPFYLPVALGFYASEGLDVSIATAGAGGSSTSALLAGETEFVWGGPMQVMRHHDEDPRSPVVAFCEVVTRDPFFLVGREPKPDFRFSDLMHRRIATVSEAPTPWLCLQEDIGRSGIDPEGLDRIADRSMAENADALRAGTLDVIQVFEPFVEQLVREGVGHIWYAAASRGATSYTTLITTRRVIETAPERVLAMTRAAYRAQKWVSTRAAPDIAEAVKDYFPDLDLEILAACIERYRRLDVWGKDPLLPVTGFVRQKLGLLSGGLITRDVPYENCVETRFAEEVVRTVR
ncbi:NitT/TauT family transport system substrate-binding protein [Constrictibacter sp. MBR-5]|jgi:NitT/TauT family transport system substrate-binding protein|uniref:ABC transporter substrate-binding protein n=1 Tax=Constrictibacter sp. MBR-5 TaxID=3156467 RepID=UPI0033943837